MHYPNCLLSQNLQYELKNVKQISDMLLVFIGLITLIVPVFGDKCFQCKFIQKRRTITKFSLLWKGSN